MIILIYYGKFIRKESPMAHIIDGKKLSAAIKKRVAEDVIDLAGFGIDVGLGLMIAGNDPASKAYLNATLNACDKVGITPFCTSSLIQYP